MEGVKNGPQDGGGKAVVAAAGADAAGAALLRPTVDQGEAGDEIISMMTKCWSEDPLDRPDFAALKVAIRKLNKLVPHVLQFLFPPEYEYIMFCTNRGNLPPMGLVPAMPLCILERRGKRERRREAVRRPQLQGRKIYGVPGLSRWRNGGVPGFARSAGVAYYNTGPRPGCAANCEWGIPPICHIRRRL